MAFKTEWVRLGAKRQDPALCAWPERAGAPVPGVIVIQEAWGVDPHIEDVTLRFARAGYVALSPDLFAEGGERPAAFAKPRMEALKDFVNTLPPAAWADPKLRDEALAKLPEPRRAEVGESFGALMAMFGRGLDGHVPRLLDCAEYLRKEHPLSKGAKVGAVGFCMGGGLSVRLACADPKLGAAVIFYGTAPGADDLARIACPVMGFYGGADARVNAGIPDLVAAMQKHGKRFEHHVYEGAQHAFFNETRPAYDARASRDAFARTLEFFRKEL
jgi:carboxymethylenebutenolidase